MNILPTLFDDKNYYYPIITIKINNSLMFITWKKDTEEFQDQYWLGILSMSSEDSIERDDEPPIKFNIIFRVDMIPKLRIIINRGWIRSDMEIYDSESN
jgi:hypothetical protein